MMMDITLMSIPTYLLQYAIHINTLMNPFVIRTRIGQIFTIDIDMGHDKSSAQCGFGPMIAV